MAIGGKKRVLEERGGAQSQIDEVNYPLQGIVSHLLTRKKKGRVPQCLLLPINSFLPGSGFHSFANGRLRQNLALILRSDLRVFVAKFIEVSVYYFLFFFPLSLTLNSGWKRSCLIFPGARFVFNHPTVPFPRAIYSAKERSKLYPLR